MNYLDSVVIGQPTAMTLRDVLTLVVQAATPMIEASPSGSATLTDLTLANEVLGLAPNVNLTPAQITATARVVALGTDWLRSNQSIVDAAYPPVALLLSYIPPGAVEQFTIDVLTKGGQ